LLPTRSFAASPELDELKQPASEMRATIEWFEADRGNLTRSAPSTVSPAYEPLMRGFQQQWLKRLAGIDFDAMSLDGRIDYVLFRNFLEREARELDLDAKSLSDQRPLIPFAPMILGLDDTRRKMEKIDSAKAADTLNSLKKEIERTRKAVEAGMKSQGGAKVSKTTANRAWTTVNSLRRTLREWFGFYNGYDPVFTWWAAEPYKAADQAIQSYASFLREQVGGIKESDENAIVGDPIGREALLSDLAYEMIPYTPEELIELANKEFAWCEGEMKKASQEMGFGDDWHKALEKVKTQHVEPGKQPGLIRDLANEAIAFVDQHDLVTVPQLCRDSWRMEMMTPQRQLVNPFFTGGEVISVSFPTNTMAHEDKLMSMRGNNIHFSRATVHHELIPGHGLQAYMTARYRTHRRLFTTPFWTEGWALYWEMFLYDMNFPKSPEDRVGMLFWRMHRCARIIFSLNFHLEKMSPQECIDFLVDRVGHERENATAEVRRSFNGSYGPLYQAAYMLGGLQIRAMHKELVDSGKMTNRQFHDAILKQNRIPIEMVRAALTDQKITRDFKSSWRFYDVGPAPKAAP
jgi:uncharacterized protein (DUF885 family)